MRLQKLSVSLVALLALSITAQVRQKIDFVVGVDGNFKAAQTQAAAKASAQNRFVIFFPSGEYPIGTLTGDDNQKTTFKTSNVSFIGQETQSTSITNKSTNEGISITATLFFDKADNIYMQDITIHNKANYGNVSSYNETGRHVAIQEQGKKFIYKNVRLLSTQDTYYTKGTKTYWENGEIHGTTDFICGGGDVYFNECKIYALKKSALTAAASTGNDWGYVFKNCTFDGASSAAGYTFGRSWNNAKTVLIGSTLKLLPTAEGWGNPMNSVPQVFAEYQSKNSSGQLLDLSARRKTYTKDDITVTLNPVLTANQAAQYTIENVLGGTDNWRPHDLTVQVPAPQVTLNNNKLSWSDQSAARYWAIFKNGKYLDNTISTSYTLNNPQDGEIYTVRAANQMGGLGASSAGLTYVSGPQQQLQVSVAQGVGNTTPGAGEFRQNTTISLTANPNGNWKFSHWAGDLSGTQNPQDLTLSSDKTVQVYFEPVDYFSYQCEYGTMHESIFEAKNSGFNGTGYVNFNAVLGAQVSVPILVSEAGEYLLNLRYANGGDYTRQLGVKLAGTDTVIPLEFPSTGAWTTWNSLQTEISFPAGASTLEFVTLDDRDGPNLDEISFSEKPTIITGGGPNIISGARFNPTTPRIYIPAGLRNYDLLGKRISPTP